MRGRQEKRRAWAAVADVSIDDPEKLPDRFLVGGDRIEIAHSMTVPLVAVIPRLLPRRDVRAPEPDQVAALVRITAGLGTRPATHPLFKLPDWCFPGAP